jgi:hypothetical protein
MGKVLKLPQYLISSDVSYLKKGQASLLYVTRIESFLPIGYCQSSQKLFFDVMFVPFSSAISFICGR